MNTVDSNESPARAAGESGVAATTGYGDLTVIIPTLEEHSTIGSLIEALEQHCPGLNIIVSDDSPGEETVEACASAARRMASRGCDVSRFRFIRRNKPQDRGLTASVLDAIQICGTPYLVVMDGDWQHPPEVVSRICGVLRKGVEIVAGAREELKDGMNVWRRCISTSANAAARLRLRLQGCLVRDPMSGLFGINTELAQRVTGTNARFERGGYKVLFDFLKAAGPDHSRADLIYEFSSRPDGQSKFGWHHAALFLKSLFE